MGKTATLDPASLAVCRAAYERYYRTYPPPVPRDLEQREFAVFTFEAPGMRRHMAFPEPELYHRSLVSQVPRHAYYSSAHYGDPGAAVMKQKGWLGADLIFDLDADHLRGAASTYPEQLDQVKSRFQLLLDEYVFRDFGLAEEDVTLTFSGGRGYHAHIHAEGFQGLRSDERREIVEYIQGIGFDPLQDAIRELAIERRPMRSEGGMGYEAWQFGGDGTVGDSAGAAAPKGVQRDRAWVLKGEEAPGWPERFTRILSQEARRWESSSAESVARELESWGSLPPKRAQAIAKVLVKEGGARMIWEKHVLQKFKSPSEREEFLRAVKDHIALEVQGETDAPVTTDIHRLIRLPGSLHGGTGLIVRPLTRATLPEFEPLRDALVPDSLVPPQEVRLLIDVDYPLGGETVRAHEGEVLTLPGPKALFLLLRGEATVAPKAP